MDINSPSGIYKCKACGNEETHVEGEAVAPCSKCGSNSNWKIICYIASLLILSNL